MTWQIKPKSLSGTFVIPSSKSHSIRALLFGLLANGKSVIYNLLPSPGMIQTCRDLGAKIQCYCDRTEIVGVNGKVDGAKQVIQAGDSGLILRLIGALAGLSSKPITIMGNASIQFHRPVTPLFDALKQLGADVISDRAPFVIRGPIHPGRIEMEGEDSQPVSGMLIAGSLCGGEVEIRVKNPGERPWIDLTLDWFDRLGVKYQREGYSDYRVEGRSQIEGFEYSVPGDFSSAAFPLVAAILTGSEITLTNLDFNDPQGDKALIPILQKMGANLKIDSRGIHVKKTSSLKGIEIDLNDVIDALPILSVVGCFAEGETCLTNAVVARKKESDRISVMTKELRKMGAEIEEYPDGLVIRKSKLRGASLDSHLDHRVAMSLAVAAFAAEGETSIHRVECVTKTYPNFSKCFDL